MKVKITLDCSADEMRQFFGFPDVQPLQHEMLEHLAEKMREGAGGLDMVNMMKPFLTPNPQAMDAMQKVFMQGFGLAAGGKKETRD